MSKPEQPKPATRDSRPPAKPPGKAKDLPEASMEETGNEDPGAELAEIINRAPPPKPGGPAKRGG
jgi:hypothetical protein